MTRTIYAFNPTLGFINFIAIGLLYTALAIAACQVFSEYAKGNSNLKFQIIVI